VVSTLGSGGPRHKEFVSELIVPVEGAFDTAAMATGEPGLPRRFRWRDEEYQVAEVLEKRKTTGPCSHGSGERYVRKHWFRVLMADGTEMEIYFDRQARTREVKRRWWLATVIRPS
jgi:phosphoribosylglycinamide formyltransferase-1